MTTSSGPTHQENSDAKQRRPLAEVAQLLIGALVGSALMALLQIVEDCTAEAR